MDEDQQTTPSDVTPARSRRRRWIWLGGGTALAFALLVGGIWIARKPIAGHYIDQQFRDSGVQAQYDIARIGPRTQRLENLVIGDPANPDLTADWVEVDLGYGFFGVRVTGIRTDGVLLNASYYDGKLSFGALDRLIPKSDGEASLPDIDAELGNTRINLATDAGPVAFALRGIGNLRSGFSGRVDGRASVLRFGNCALDRVSAGLDLQSLSGELRFKGPIRTTEVSCPETAFVLSAPVVDADMRADPALQHLNGAFALSADGARLRQRSMGRLTGLVTLTGSTEQLEGSAAMAATSSDLGEVRTGTIKFGGNFAARPRARDQAYSYSPVLDVENIVPASGDLLNGIGQRVASTPLAPLALKLETALRSASRSNRLTMSMRLTGEGKVAQLLVNGGRFSAASGAKVELEEGSRAIVNLPGRDWSIDGQLSTSGGGLPQAGLSLAPRPDGGTSGVLTVDDYRAGDARLSLTPVHFLIGPDRSIRVNSTVTLDGPLGDGAVRGLVVPLDLHMTSSGHWRVPRDCVPLRWSSLRISTLDLDPARLTLCGVGESDLRLASVALRGHIGDSPMVLAAEDARYQLDAGQFSLRGLDLRIGKGEDPVVLQTMQVEGELAAQGGFTGRLQGGHALIGTVPFDLSDIAGDWRFSDGGLGISGALRIADRQQDIRFHPLRMVDAHLTLADGRIDADGRIAHPTIGSAFANVKIVHELESGEGRADFALDGLKFDGGFAPSDITPLTQGIVQLVEGAVTGSGFVRWTSDGVAESRGSFATQDLDFAGAFGPVKGLSTTITFTDLLGMRTAPHQHLTVRQVSPGVDVFDGSIDYALLSNEDAVIEGGRWPFAGGTLELLPARVHLDAREPRSFAFRVIGVEAGAFIQTLDLENISATGTFDGLFPIIFDADGGRIEGGVLVARQLGMPPLLLSGARADVLPVCDTTRQAGTLSYVGPVSDAQLGTMGKLAFNVLKHLRYKCLTVRLDGSLDDEFVTQVQINGINQGSEEARKSFLTRPLIGLPFIFNIRIEAPFRGLIGMYSTFQDPRAFVQEELRRQRAEQESSLAVQPPESDKQLEGKQE